jgi:hypothetical protein
MHMSGFCELDRPGTNRSFAPGLRANNLQPGAKLLYAGSTLSVAVLLCESRRESCLHSNMGCPEEYDETCRIGTGVAPRSALVWHELVHKLVHEL